jgi:hypothetical protein
LAHEFSDENVEFWLASDQFYLAFEIERRNMTPQQRHLLRGSSGEEGLRQKALSMQSGAEGGRSTFGAGSDRATFGADEEKGWSSSAASIVWDYTDRMLVEAERIHNTFVHKDAPKQVNIAGTLRATIGRTVSAARARAEGRQPNGGTGKDGGDGAGGGDLDSSRQPLHICFVPAQAQIYQLMEQDNFPRFKKSPLFTKLLLDLDVYRQNSIRHIRLDRMGDSEEMLLHTKEEFSSRQGTFSLPGSGGSKRVVQSGRHAL